jgi:hypothetical protein
MLIFAPVQASWAQGAPKAHRIQIRRIGKNAEFFDQATGKRFIPRGNNYIRLDHLRKKTEGTMLLYHSTFNNNLYEHARALRSLTRMSEEGYNTVRVFLNPVTDGGITSDKFELSSSYVDNLADFLTIARTSHIFVLITVDWIPLPRPGGTPDPLWCSDYQCTNRQILSVDGVSANQTFFRQLVEALIKHSAPLDAVLGYELRNELTFEPDLPPLSTKSGTIRTANGLTYDLSSAAEKGRMVEEGLVFWIDRMRDAIRGVDPTALVTVGFIPPQKPHPIRIGETKLSITSGPIRRSTVDFVDLHVYPVLDRMTMRDFAENFDIVGQTAKPVIIGELGAMTATYPSAEAATAAMLDWQAASCSYGIQGWLLWSWDVDHQNDSWAAVDSDGLLEKALSPKNRPDPCAPTTSTLPRKNAAARATARASRTGEGFDPADVLDGTMRPWNAGDAAPQWIEIDLGRQEDVIGIRLVVSQSPPGPTDHQIWIRGADEAYRMVHEFQETTSDFQRLEWTPPAAQRFRFVKVLTLKSPSWVGWREVEVIRTKAK